MSNKISLNIRCPSCKGELQPSVLMCHSCGIKIEGEFIKNEFNSLTPDELHFLRVFIRCEGRISEMEASLGVSYPTVKAYLANLKKNLNLASADSGEENGVSPSEPQTPPEDDALTILTKLEKGEIDFKKAVQIVRNKKRQEKK